MTIPTTQFHISVKKLKRLIRKLCSMHLAVPGTIGHFYAMQGALTCARAANKFTAKLFARFHQDIKLWQRLSVNMKTHRIYLAKLVHRAPSNIGYIDSLVQGSRGVWIGPTEDGITFA